MSITVAKAISRREMEDWANGGGICAAIDRDWALIDFVNTFDKVWIISVAGVKEDPLFKENSNIICLNFADIDPDDHFSYKDFEALCWVFDEKIDSSHLFSKEQAKKVANFIKLAHANPGNDLLLVNCVAGISRSGAIVRFAGEFCGINPQIIHSHNPKIRPNLFVLDKLREAAEIL